MWKIYKREESEQLENILKDFIRDFNLNITNNTDIIELCHSLGFKVLMMPLRKYMLDGLILVENEDKVIGVNQDLPIEKARFVIAHELSHFITQSTELKKSKSNKQLFFATKDNVYHDYDKSQLEHDMDYLAAAILVPKHQFIEELESFGIDVKKFKDLKKEEVIRGISISDLEYFAKRYNVETEVIIKRIVEVSYYV